MLGDPAGRAVPLGRQASRRAGVLLSSPSEA
jgi:hypothetical protein